MGHLSEQILGVTTDDEDLGRSTTVQTTAGRIINANPNRVQLYLANPGGNDVYLLDSSEVAVNEGFLLEANGGTLTFRIDVDGDLVHEEFHAVADGGTSDVFHRGEVAVRTHETAQEET